MKAQPLLPGQNAENTNSLTSRVAQACPLDLRFFAWDHSKSRRPELQVCATLLDDVKSWRIVQQ